MAFGDDDLDFIYSSGNPMAVLAAFNVNGSTVNVYGHFTERTDTVDIVSGQPIAIDASIDCRSSEVDSVKRDRDTVTIDGTTYTVKQKQNVGTGSTLVILKT